jgi:hypothetical protein
MGFISKQLQEQNPVPEPEDTLPPWVICPYCKTQVRKTREDDFCSLLCKKRWDTEKTAVDRLNTEYKSVDEVIAAMDVRLKPRK